MMKRVTTLLAAGLVLLLGAPALAQTTTGSISGTIVSTDGSALPGVTVEVSGENLQGVRSVTSDANGRFRVINLPPGNYQVTYRLEGFSPVEEDDVSVRIGTDTARQVSMSAGVSEQIVVQGESVIVDTTKTTIDTQVDWELIDSLPNNRLFQDVMSSAPGVQINASNPTVNGAADSDNIYLVDGVDTTDPRTQTWGTAINFDTIQEVQIQTAGIPAEYGRVQGGVVNLVTNSGGNQFHGSARFVVSDVDWVADTKDDAVPAIFGDEKRPSATLGGPLAQDKLWFFIAGEGRDREQNFPRETGSDTGEFATDVSTYEGHYASAKLTWQVNSNNTLTGFYNTDPIDISNAWARYYLGPSVDPRSEATQEQGGDNMSLQWSSVLGASMLFEAKANKYEGNINIVAQGPIGPDPTTLDLVTGYWSGTSLEEYKSVRGREGAQVTLTKFLDSSLGSHQLKGGLEYLKMQNEVTDLYYPQGNFLMTAGGSYLYRAERYDRPGELVTENPYLALFFQDSWTRDRMTLNLGVRAEQVALKNNTGEEVLKFDFTDQIAPRLGFAYDINGNSLHATASRFYDIVTDYVTAGLNRNNESERFYIWLPYYGYGDYCSDHTEDASGNLDSDCWLQVDDYPLVANNSIDSGIDPTYTDEFTLGYDHRLSPHMSGGINLIWREQNDAIEDFDLDDNGSYNYSNVSGSWKKYQAVQLFLRKRLAQDRFQFNASYTYAFKNEGFSTGDQLSGFADSSVSVANRYGDLDTPHLVKAQGSYTIPWGSAPTSTQIGVSGYWYSGPVYASFRRVRVGSGTFSEFIDPDLEVGEQWQLDLHLEQEFKIGAIEASVYGDMFNVTDNQDPLNRQGTVTSAAFRNPTSSQAPRRYQLGVKVSF